MEEIESSYEESKQQQPGCRETTIASPITIEKICKDDGKGKRIRVAIIKALRINGRYMTITEIDQKITKSQRYGDVGNELEVAIRVGIELSHLETRGVIIEKIVRYYEREKFVREELAYQMNRKERN